MDSLLMFSQPPPLGRIVTFSLSPGTMSVWTMGGVLSPGVDARREGLLDDGVAQEAVLVSAPHAVGKRIVQVTAHEVDVLAQLQEQHRGACVLAERNLLLLRNLRVAENHVQDLLRPGRLLVATRLLQGVQHVLRQEVVGLLGQPRDRVSYVRYVYVSHAASE